MSGQLSLWPSAEDHNGFTPRLDAGDRSPIADGPRGSRSVKRQLVMSDMIAVLVGFGVAFVIQAIVKPLTSYGVSQHAVLMVLSLPGFAIGAATTRLYQARANERPSQESRNVLWAVAIGVALMVLLAFAMQFKELSRLWIALVALCVAATVLCERWQARLAFARMRATG